MKKSSKSSLLFLIIGLAFAWVAASWYFSQKPETEIEPEAEYYYPTPEPSRRAHPQHIKGG